MDTEKELNAKIMNITMTIQEKHPELSEDFEEMHITVPNLKSPEFIIKNLRTDIKNLRTYFDSLTSILEKY